MSMLFQVVFMFPGTSYISMYLLKHGLHSQWWHENYGEINLNDLKESARLQMCSSGLYERWISWRNHDIPPASRPIQRRRGQYRLHWDPPSLWGPGDYISWYISQRTHSYCIISPCHNGGHLCSGTLMLENSKEELLYFFINEEQSSSVENAKCLQ